VYCVPEGYAPDMTGPRMRDQGATRGDASCQRRVASRTSLVLRSAYQRACDERSGDQKIVQGRSGRNDCRFPNGIPVGSKSSDRDRLKRDS